MKKVTKKVKKSKILKLKPSAKDKRQYLLISESNHDEVKKAILDYIGILGMAKASYLPVKKNLKKEIIGSCTRSELSKVKAALGLSGIKVLKVSSTIRGLY